MRNLRFEANKNSLHIRLYSLRTEYPGAPCIQLESSFPHGGEGEDEEHGHGEGGQHLHTPLHVPLVLSAWIKGMMTREISFLIFLLIRSQFTRPLIVYM